jgi:hypothetical protein
MSQQATHPPSVDTFHDIQLTERKIIRINGYPKLLLEYKDIVYEKLQNLFKFNNRIFVRGIRVV